VTIPTAPKPTIRTPDVHVWTGRAAFGVAAFLLAEFIVRETEGSRPPLSETNALIAFMTRTSAQTLTIVTIDAVLMAFVIVFLAGFRQIIKNSAQGLEWIADTFLSVATPVQLGLERLLAATESVRTQIRERTAANFRVAKEIFGSSSACQILSAEGGWNIVIHVPGTRSEEEWALGLLRDADVYLQPGFFYDFEAEAYMVVSLLTEPAAFREGLERLSRYVDR